MVAQTLAAPSRRSFVPMAWRGRAVRPALAVLLALTFLGGALDAPGVAEARKSKQTQCAAMWSMMKSLMSMSRYDLDQGNQSEAEYYAGLALDLGEDFVADCTV